jgi:hypothetical protein
MRKKKNFFFCEKSVNLTRRKMWFEATEACLCYCKKYNCAKGFPMCHNCLPSRDYLLKNYKALNANYENICGHLNENDEGYDSHIGTNCALTASMIQLEFGFLIGILTVDWSIKNAQDLFEKLQMTNFVQIEIRCKKYCGLHMMTIIGDYVVHSFLDEFGLRIRKIDQEWIDNLQSCMDDDNSKSDKWAKLCEVPDYKHYGDEFLVFFFPHANWDYKDSYKTYKDHKI